MIAVFGRIIWLRRNPIPTSRWMGSIMGLENGWHGWHIGPLELLIGPKNGGAN